MDSDERGRVEARHSMKPTLTKVPVMPESIFIIDPAGGFPPCDYCRRYGSWYVFAHENVRCPRSQTEAGSDTVVDSAFDLSGTSTMAAVTPLVIWRQLTLFKESDSSLTAATDLEPEAPQ